MTQSRFTCARLGRRMRSQYPGLNTKAVAGKRLSFWLADVAVQFAGRRGASELDRLVATTAWAYMNWLDKLDSYPMVLTPVQAEDLFKMGHLHLTTYCRLRGLSAQSQGAHSNNRCLWALLPKHHYMLHELFTMKKTRVNCRHYTLLTGESFVGTISRMARLCHRRTVSKRVLQRYRARLSSYVRNKFGERR